MTIPPVEMWFVVIPVAIATYAFRASFIAFAHRMTELPPLVSDALRMVPAAAMAALAIPAMLRPDKDWALFGPEAIAGVIAFGVAAKTKNAAMTVVVGLAAVMLLEWWL